MKYSLFMRVMDCFRYLHQAPCGLPRRERFLLDDLRQCFPSHIFHCQVRLPFLFATFVKRDNVGMAQPCYRFSFPQKSFPFSFRGAYSVVNPFQCNHPVQADVSGFENQPHCPGPNRFEQYVVAPGLAALVPTFMRCACPVARFLRRFG